MPDTAINFEFGESTYSLWLETFLSEAMPHYASLICKPEEQEVEAFMIAGYTDDRVTIYAIRDSVRNALLQYWRKAWK